MPIAIEPIVTEPIINEPPFLAPPIRVSPPTNTIPVLVTNAATGQGNSESAASSEDDSFMGDCGAKVGDMILGAPGSDSRANFDGVIRETLEREHLIDDGTIYARQYASIRKILDPKARLVITWKMLNSKSQTMILSYRRMKILRDQIKPWTPKMTAK
ncbi:hypothetical protein MMC09_005654 [Bachmanniomyces sp. S44760]|nr:hypothetical protein [Bachmanniomyces sp. S44760]